MHMHIITCRFMHMHMHMHMHMSMWWAGGTTDEPLYMAGKQHDGLDSAAKPN